MDICFNVKTIKKKMGFKDTDTKAPFFCKTSHSDDGFVYAQVALTAVFAIMGVVFMALKQWKYAYIFISSAAFSGISANTTLQIRLNTDSCYNTTKRIIYGVCSLFTLTALISWALLSLHLINIIKLGKGVGKKEAHYPHGKFEQVYEPRRMELLDTK